MFSAGHSYELEARQLSCIRNIFCVFPKLSMHDQTIRKKEFSFCVFAFLLVVVVGVRDVQWYFWKGVGRLLLTLFTTLTIFARSIDGLKPMSGGS